MKDQPKGVLILTSPIQKVKVQRINSNQPQTRHQSILSHKPQSAQTIFPSQSLTTQILKSLSVHNPLMIDYLQNCWQSFIKNPDHSYPYLQSGVVPYTFLQNTQIDPNILRKMHYWKQAGIWGKDVMTPIFQHTWQTILESANNCYAVKDHLNANKVIYCLNIYPGHHAADDKYAGYCFLNNGAILAKTLQHQCGLKNIAILDLDYHAGDGTQKIFHTDHTITTVSIHADPLLDYPYYSNFASQAQSSKNIPFQPNTDGKKYLQHVKQAMDYINTKQYDALIIPFGGDTYKDDPDASELCRCGLDFKDYQAIGKFIKGNSKTHNIIVTQQGGYNMEHIHQVVWSFLNGLSQ